MQNEHVTDVIQLNNYREDQEAFATHSNRSWYTTDMIDFFLLGSISLHAIKRNCFHYYQSYTTQIQKTGVFSHVCPKQSCSIFSWPSRASHRILQISWHSPHTCDLNDRKTEPVIKIANTTLKTVPGKNPQWRIVRRGSSHHIEVIPFLSSTYQKGQSHSTAECPGVIRFAVAKNRAH